MESYTYIHLTSDDQPMFIKQFNDFYNAISFGAKHSEENPGKWAQIINPNKENNPVVSFKMMR